MKFMNDCPQNTAAKMNVIQEIMPENKEAAKKQNKLSRKMHQRRQKYHAYSQRPDNDQIKCPEMNIKIPGKIYDSELDKNQPKPALK